MNIKWVPKRKLDKKGFGFKPCPLCGGHITIGGGNLTLISPFAAPHCLQCGSIFREKRKFMVLAGYQVEEAAHKYSPTIAQ